ncbi:hypothetical protein AUC68_08030 [Methyloceanibacter methanicus]|uniref:Uncharacterized protein n=1 Tax=Methyloceanibacter methanicus TaxID=1774968 RepID=A0A1E3VXY3_9HYPH|nr:hypothetical protein AUC68_08030 [Methyloceanibacter methanicus]
MSAARSSGLGAGVAQRPQPGLDEIAAGVRKGDRVALGRAITLIESTRPEDQARARALLKMLLPDTGKAIRIGISGVPAAGKSTLIDQFGLNLIAAGHKVAVLAVDPTSSRTGGSILGDKTRMGRLASEANAFIRPSPAGSSLGGVTKTTRETIAIAEAAGYDVVLVETVGVGQSETAVSNMVDVFVVVAIPGAGDELQGIKRGLLELADIIAVNKADSDNVERANRAATEYRAALHILASGNAAWQPAVLTMSARDNTGLDTLWQKIGECRRSSKRRASSTNAAPSRRQPGCARFSSSACSRPSRADARPRAATRTSRTRCARGGSAPPKRAPTRSPNWSG